MSVPARDSDGGPSKDGPSNYAPKKVRHPEPAPDSAAAPPKDDAAPQSPPLKRDAASRSGAAEPPEPPWRRSKQRGAFAGDVAAVELRNRLALAPDRLPEPPAPLSTGPRYGRLAGVVVVAAVGFIGYQLGSAPRSPPQVAPRSGQTGQQGPVSEQSAAAAYPTGPGLDSMSQAAQAGAARRSAGRAADTGRSASIGPALQSPQPVLTSPATAKEIALPSDEQSSRAAAPPQAVSRQLTVGAVRPLHVDEATRLTVSAADAGADAAVVIGGLVPGSTLSAGAQVGPDTWRLPVEELDRAVIAPPLGFVGAMALTLELRLADNTVADRKNLQLEWSGMNALAPAQPPSRQHDADEIALMIKTGADLMANRDFAAARLMYRRAAEAGSAMGAFALAETYDPLVVAKLNAKGGITPDVALAQMWYEKAMGLGSTVAPARLERLARLPESPE
jgi:TPR repeat protein